MCCFYICSTPCCLARCLFSVRGRAWPTRVLKKSWRKSNRVTFHLKERPGEMCRSRPKTSYRVRVEMVPSFWIKSVLESDIFLLWFTPVYMGNETWNRSSSTLTALFRVQVVIIRILFLQSCWRWTQTRGLRCVACVTTPGYRTTASYHPTPSWPQISSARRPPPSTLASKLPLMYEMAISACLLDLNNIFNLSSRCFTKTLVLEYENQII